MGMPLRFAVPADDPFRAENAIDDFITRTALGLEEIKQRVLRVRDWQFRRAIVVWDTTPEAWREWRKARSAEYQDPANASVKEPLAVNLCGVFPESSEEGMLQAETPESEASSRTLHLEVKTQKKVAARDHTPISSRSLHSSRRNVPNSPWVLGK